MHKYDSKGIVHVPKVDFKIAAIVLCPIMGNGWLSATDNCIEICVMPRLYM